MYLFWKPMSLRILRMSHPMVTEAFFGSFGVTRQKEPRSWNPGQRISPSTLPFAIFLVRIAIIVIACHNPHGQPNGCPMFQRFFLTASVKRSSALLGLRAPDGGYITMIKIRRYNTMPASWTVYPQAVFIPPHEIPDFTDEFGRTVQQQHPHPLQ